MKEFLGTGVALITPFNKDKSVDLYSLKRLVNFQIENGINYLVVLGTTGEPATLTITEKEAVKETIVAANNGRVPLILGVGGNNTASVVNDLQQLDLSAYSGILSVSPYYNKPTQEGIYQHFKAISEASPLPVIIYNVPGRTAKNIDFQTVMRLADDCKNIVGIKEAAGDMVQAMRLIKEKPADFMVISGDDMIALPMTLAGGAGVISVVAQGFPKDFSRMIKFGLQGENTKAYELHYKMMDIIDLIFEEGNPAGIKSLLETLKICNKEVRLPLVAATQNLQQKITTFAKNY